MTPNTAEKKSKNKNKQHKRKLEENTEPSEVAVSVEPTKKDKKNKKKNRDMSTEYHQEQEFVKERETLLNGSDEKSEKKRQKKENLSNGSAEIFEEIKKYSGHGAGTGEDRESADEGVTVSGKDVNDSKYKALESFSEPGLPDKVMECCKNFDKPSPIQSHSWPFLLAGRDFIGIAKTGSGIIFFVLLSSVKLDSWLWVYVVLVN